LGFGLSVKIIQGFPKTPYAMGRFLGQFLNHSRPSFFTFERRKGLLEKEASQPLGIVIVEFFYFFFHSRFETDVLKFGLLILEPINQSIQTVRLIRVRD
jgi:hypothetical protein